MALRYKPVCRGFESRWCHNPSGRTMAPGSTQPLTEMRTRDVSWGGKGGRCVGLTTLPPSCADSLEIREPQPPGTLRACNRPIKELLFTYPSIFLNMQGSILGRVKRFINFQTSRPAAGSTEAPIQWVPGLFPGRGVKRPRVRLTTHLRLVPSLTFRRLMSTIDDVPHR